MPPPESFDLGGVPGTQPCQFHTGSGWQKHHRIKTTGHTNSCILMTQIDRVMYSADDIAGYQNRLQEGAKETTMGTIWTVKAMETCGEMTLVVRATWGLYCGRASSKGAGLLAKRFWKNLATPFILTTMQMSSNGLVPVGNIGRVL